MLICLLYFSNIASVPFHPDESTQLTMSSDLEALLSNPSSLAWDPHQEMNSSQTYRLLDAPLTRYLLGTGRLLANLPPPTGFWDWSLEWQANLERGAMPEPKTLLVGRLAVSLLFPFSMILLYICTRIIGGRIAGYTAIFLLGLNALVLLHTRRAMAEGALIFGINAVLASWLLAPRRPWLAGVAMAVAFNSKQSTLALLPVGLLAVSWFSEGDQHRLGSITWNIAQYLLTFIALTWLLNPIAWQHPIEVARVAASARADLLSRQIADTQRLAPSQLLDQSTDRAVFLLGHLYLTPPIFAEAQNYDLETEAAESHYIGSLFTNIGRNPSGAGLWLALTVLGLLATVRNITDKNYTRQRFTMLTLLGTICMAGGLLLAVPLPWQRYVLPMVPFACMWAGVGFAWLVRIFFIIKRQPKPFPI